MERSFDDHDPGRPEDMLANMLGKLTETQRATYDRNIENVYTDVQPHIGFQIAVAGTLLRNLDPKMQDFALGEITSLERESIRYQHRDARNEDAHRDGTPQRPPNNLTMEEFIPGPAHAGGQDHLHANRAPQPDLAAARRDGFGDHHSTPERIQHMPGNYGGLQQYPAQTMPKPAAEPVQQTQPGSHPAPEAAQHLGRDFSPNSLHAMLDRYAHLSAQHGIQRSQKEDYEFKQLANAQRANQFALEGDKPRILARDEQQHDRILHQQLAQYVSLEASWMSHHLGGRDPAESKRCAEESRDCANVAKLIGKDIIAARDGKPAARDIGHAQEQDVQSKRQDAGNHAKELSDATPSAGPTNQHERQGRVHDDSKHSSLRRADEAAIRAMGNNNGRSGRGR